ncbi:MAG: fluoride efflux transporter CrcB [Methylococcales bacterium]
MNQLFAIALGGSCGAVLRFLVSSGVYQWLGRGFPYGTLTVNVLGSFLLGLLTEALILQRIAIAFEYRSAILVGFIGAFTTFSTFSLETLYLLEQGQLLKALLNISVSILACLFAVWIGLYLGRYLFLYSGQSLQWSGGLVPYGLMLVNLIGAFLVGLLLTVLLQKVDLSMEHRAALLIILIGTYLTLSGLYLVFYQIEHGYGFDKYLNVMLAVFIGNGLLCVLVMWLGLLLGKQV